MCSWEVEFTADMDSLHIGQQSGSTSTEDSNSECSSITSGEEIPSPPSHPVTNNNNNTGIMDLFSIQLEVTHRLLNAEETKMAALQRDICSHLCKCQHQCQEIRQLQANLGRFKQQYEQLHEEYNQSFSGILKSSNLLRKSSRSQPAMGIKNLPKARPTIFGTIAKGKPIETSRRVIGRPQMSGGAGVAASGSGSSSPNAHDSNEKDALIYQDGQLVSGSFEALVQHLVPTSTYYPDRTYIFAFLLSSRLFVKPHALFQQVCQVCTFQQNLYTENVTKESLGKFGPHCIQLLSEWTEMFPYDFRDERMMKQLKDLTQRIVKIFPELRKDVGIIMHNLLAKLAGLHKYEELLIRINQEVAHRLLNIMPTTDIYEVCSSPAVLAQQLTHIEMERLSMIGSEEFVQAFAKENEIEMCYKDVKKTNNLEAYVQWFNRLSYFVATEICMHLKKRNRVRMIEYFVDVAKECTNIGNFNSLMAIIAGMNMNPIQRLKKTWAKVNRDKFEILEHQMNPSNNFLNYRSSLKAALWRAQGAAEDRERIVIPFFSLFVKDMYFLNEGCQNKSGDGYVNFEKFWQLAKQITDFIAWKQVECPFDKHPPVLNYMLTNPVFSENSLALASFECEPPENSYEKTRYKHLKEQAGL